MENYDVSYLYSAKLMLHRKIRLHPFGLPTVPPF